MKVSEALNQYVNICNDALNSSTKLRKNFKSLLIETLILYMVIPQKINFTQMNRYGKHVEQTYRNNFKKQVDWIGFNLSLCQRLFEKSDRKAIAIDPSYISKSGRHTPWVGYFWSGCAGQAKRGLEILGIGLVDIDKRDCLSLRAVQTPDTESLSDHGKNLIDWYLGVLHKNRGRLLQTSKYVVADAFFSKSSFSNGLIDMGFHLVSRFRDDALLRYKFRGERTGKRGCPKKHGDKIDFKNPNYSKMLSSSQEGELYSLTAYSKALARDVSLVIWLMPKGGHNLYFSTDTDMSGKDVIEYYRTRFQIEFCFRNSKQFTGRFHCQARDIRKMDFAFNASLAAVNVAKVMISENGTHWSINSVKSLMYNSFILKRFIDVSGYKPNKTINEKLIGLIIELSAYAA